MAFTKCEKCGGLVHSSGNTCLRCGATQNSNNDLMDSRPSQNTKMLLRAEIDDLKVRLKNAEDNQLQLARHHRQSMPTQPQPIQSHSRNTANSTDYGNILLVIPFVATLLVWFWISSMNLFQSPRSMMMLILLFTVGGTAFYAYKEARAHQSHQSGSLGPMGWFVLISLFWIFTYPYYMANRSTFNLPNRFISGLTVAAIFFFSWLIMFSAIESQVSSIRSKFEDIQRDLNNL